MHASAALLIAGLLAGQAADRPNKIWEKGTIAVHTAKDEFVPVRGQRPVLLDDRYFMRAGVYWGRNYLPNPDFPGIERKPTCYHHADGPVGVVMDAYDWFRIRPRDYGVNDVRMPASLIALGGSGNVSAWSMLAHTWSEPPLAESTMSCGTIAGYGRPYQAIRFFEDDKRPFELCDPAKGEPLFTFVRDARRRGCNVETYFGPRRPNFEKQAVADYYAAIFVEACPRDRLEDIAVEWMTREGMASLAKAIRSDGVIAYHTSNRYMVMPPLLIDVANYLELSTLLVRDAGDYQDRQDSSHYGSEWVLVARDPARLKRIRDAMRGRKHLTTATRPRSLDRYPGADLAVPAKILWTDKGPNSIEGLFRISPMLARKEEEFRRKDPAATIYLAMSFLVAAREDFFLSEYHRRTPDASALKNEPTDRIDPERMTAWTKRIWAEMRAERARQAAQPQRFEQRFERKSQ
jgi:hypothetical protein